MTGSGVSYLSPAIEYWQGLYRVWFVEKYTGALAYSRLHQCAIEGTLNLKQDLWSEPVAFEYSGSDFGVAAAAGTDLWLVAAPGVWAASAPPEALDVGADVVSADVDIEGQGAKVRLVLDNSHGRYSGGGSDVAKVGLGRRLRLSFGYRTSAGAESSDGPAYWVTGDRAGVV